MHRSPNKEHAARSVPSSLALVVSVAAGACHALMPMSARSIPRMSLRCLHGRPCMTVVERTQPWQTTSHPAMAVALVTWVSQMATNTMGSSIPAAPRRALLLVLVYTERTGETLGTVGSASSGGPSC